MEHLTKQQIVLLTLLVSFVTSIATGIVTVSLMGQAPMGVTQTINRIVERTIEKVPVESVTKSAAVINTLDPVSIAVEKVSKSIVRIKPAGASTELSTGLGLMVSNDGIIVTDKAAVAPQGNLVALFSNGEEFPIQVIQSQIDGDIVFATVDIPSVKKAVLITQISFTPPLKLGQTVLAISGKNLDSLSQGIVKKAQGEGQATTETSINPSDLIVGSPLFTVSGEVIGLKTSSNTNSFYPINSLRPNIPVLTPTLSH